MKDLKENIQKNNMKKLVLSAVLGMFCYCTNKATNQPAPQPTIEIINIDKALTLMLTNQVKINAAKKDIEAYNKKIYTNIQDENKKITKKNVLGFIKKQYTTDNSASFDDINKIKQYFHLEEIKDNNEECKEENITEIFWTAPTDQEEIGGITSDEQQKIKEYFNTIIKAEKAISEEFKKYYDTKMQGKGEGEAALGDIAKECYANGEGNSISEKFSAKLKNLCTTASIQEEVAKNIITTIKKRITPDGQITEEKLKNFIKQKIEEEKKEPVKPVEAQHLPSKKGGCPCCDC